jgi:hypothetical protein
MVRKLDITSEIRKVLDEKRPFEIMLGFAISLTAAARRCSRQNRNFSGLDFVPMLGVAADNNPSCSL